MYDDDDPLLNLIRPIALALPEAIEVESHGRPTFRAAKPQFAVYGAAYRDDPALLFKPDEAERPALVADARFF